MSGSAIHVVGGGLAGPEAAYQLARLGHRVRLYEMRPGLMTPAHQTQGLAELVCSNSLKSEKPHSAPWLLKEELRRMGALCMRAAADARVPGGNALTVDREVFSARVGEAIEREPLIEIVREEVESLPVIGSTGAPDVASAMAKEMNQELAAIEGMQQAVLGVAERALRPDRKPVLLRHREGDRNRGQGAVG